MVVAMGFSTSTWAPAFRKARTISAWVTAGEQTLTRSTLPSKFAPVGDGRHSHDGPWPWRRISAIGIGDGEQFDVFAALAQGVVFGGVMMAEDAGADDGGFQRSIFRHAAAKKQGWKSPTNLGAYKGPQGSKAASKQILRLVTNG